MTPRDLAGVAVAVADVGLAKPRVAPELAAGQRELVPQPCLARLLRVPRREPLVVGDEAALAAPLQQLGAAAGEPDAAAERAQARPELVRGDVLCQLDRHSMCQGDSSGKALNAKKYRNVFMCG